MGPFRRYFIAGVIPFFSVFSATLIQYKIIFALGGMVNHTLVRNLSEEAVLNNLNTSIDFPGTCISKTSTDKLNHIGPFAWSPAVESGIISTSLIGTLTGMVLVLHVYNYLDARLVYSATLFISGLLCIVTPVIGINWGGYVLFAVAEFLESCLTALLTPMIPTVVNNWFLTTEIYVMTNIIWLGLDSARICFSASGYIIETIGWQYLFYFPGGLAVIMSMFFYVFMTQEPLDNLFIDDTEKLLIAKDRGSKFEAPKVPCNGFHKNLVKFKKDIKIKPESCCVMSVPYAKIFKTPMFWLSVMQTTSQSWIMSMMVLMNKDFYEEIHGYSVEESSMMVTLPNNLFMIAVFVTAGHFADFLAQIGVKKLTIRRIGVCVQILSVLPMSVMSFLPCEVLQYREVATFIQIFSSLRGFGNLAGYSSLRDLSPRFHGTLVSLSSFSSNCIPGLVISFFKGVFGYTPIDAWQKNYTLNCCIVICLSLLYLIFLDTSPAPWDPCSKKEEKSSV